MAARYHGIGNIPNSNSTLWNHQRPSKIWGLNFLQRPFAFLQNYQALYQIHFQSLRHDIQGKIPIDRIMVLESGRNGGVHLTPLSFYTKTYPEKSCCKTFWRNPSRCANQDFLIWVRSNDSPLWQKRIGQNCETHAFQCGKENKK